MKKIFILLIHVGLACPSDADDFGPGGRKLQDVTLVEVFEYLTTRRQMRLALEIPPGKSAWIDTNSETIGHDMGTQGFPKLSVSVEGEKGAEILKKALEFNPNFELQPVGKFLHVLPKGAIKDPNNILSRRLPGFRTTEDSLDRLPSVKESLQKLVALGFKEPSELPELVFGHYGFNLDGWRIGQPLAESIGVVLGPCTLREAINAVLEQTPGGFWSYHPRRRSKSGTIYVGTAPRSDLSGRSTESLLGTILQEGVGEEFYAREALISRELDFAELDEGFRHLRAELIYIACMQKSQEGLGYLESISKLESSQTRLVAKKLEYAIDEDGGMPTSFANLLKRLSRHAGESVSKAANSTFHLKNTKKARWLGNNAPESAAKELIGMLSEPVGTFMVVRALNLVGEKRGAPTATFLLRGKRIVVDYPRESRLSLVKKLGDLIGLPTAVSDGLKKSEHVTRKLTSYLRFEGDAAEILAGFSPLTDASACCIVHNKSLLLASPSEAIEILKKRYEENPKRFE
ncbi:MAG: hypothetical protein QF473_15895 [Planctomycetota bacterium]|nr:hypothetical protein [Planctomycetota bacterium]